MAVSMMQGCLAVIWSVLTIVLAKPRQRLLYVYASLNRLDFRGLPEKLIIVFESVILTSDTHWGFWL
jgi:hypothetical protein